MRLFAATVATSHRPVVPVSFRSDAPTALVQLGTLAVGGAVSLSSSGDSIDVGDKGYQSKDPEDADER